MFEDLYKQANDKIDTDSPKSRVMARLSQSPVPVRRSYRAAKAAALAACFVVTVAAAGIYESIQKETEVMPGMMPEMSVLEPAETGAADVQDISAAPTEAPKVPKAKMAPEPEPKEAKPVVKNEASEKAAATDEAAVPETAADYAEENTADSVQVQAQEQAAEKSIANFAPIQPQEQAAEEKMVSGGGGSGGGAARARSALVVNEGSVASPGTSAAYAMTHREEKEVSVEEYCQYLGKNIPEEVVLPEGVKNVTTPTQMFPINEDGTYAEDEYTFLFMGEEKLIQIETTKNTDAVQEMIDDPAYQKSPIGDNNAVVLSHGDALMAYLENDHIGYTITAVGCTEAELANLLVSLN